MHETCFFFSKSIFQPASSKYVLSVFFRFRNISGRYFGLDIKFRYFSKKFEISFLQHIWLLSQKLPGFLPRSSNMIKPLLELCRMDPGDAFTYLSWYHITSTSNFRIREKKISNFIFYAYFLKGNFKELPEKVFSARFQLFFHRILKIFL